MLTLAPASAATSGKRSLVLRSCNDAPLGKVIAAVGLPLASTVGAVIVAGAVCAGSLSAANAEDENRANAREARFRSFRHKICSGRRQLPALWRRFYAGFEVCANETVWVQFETLWVQNPTRGCSGGL